MVNREVQKSISANILGRRVYAIKKDGTDLCATKKSCSHLCVIDINLFTLYVIPSKICYEYVVKTH
jgi:hypothetical protein